MQPRPTAAELLACVTEVLEQEIVPALDGPAQHHARVAASLVAIVERELRLGDGAADREREALAPFVAGEHATMWRPSGQRSWPPCAPGHSTMTIGQRRCGRR